MKKFSALLILLCCIVCSSADLLSQTTRNCGTMGHLEMLQQKHPEVVKNMEQIEKHTNRVLQSTSSNQKVNGVITIPVVVHVLYNTSAQNISNAQIQSQIDVLNEDFRRNNSDASNTPGDFLGVAADSEIEFCMATVDPNGNSTNGITRKSTSNSSWGTNDQMKSSSSGGTDAWDTGKYLNIWVCNLSGGILGYAQFPGGPAATDGVVCLTTAFGTTGNVNAPFNLGRTTTHEVGHWLNLRHIWGDGGCGVDDFVSDTPASDGPNYTGSPCTYPGPVSCGTNDMFQNYMDYSDDGCMNMYTTGQKNRMRALFDSGGFRASLLTSGGCGAPAPPTCTDGIQNGDEEGVDCGGSNCTPCVSGCGGDTEVTVSITFDNYPEETSWSLTNSSGSTVASGGTYGSSPDGSTFTEAVCLPNGCYDFTINDAYGDGICCSYGNGSYSVTDASGTLASGGSFSSSETTNFCLGGTAPTCTDGVQNGNETGVDCGGPDCAACPTCSDGVQNGNETGVDCGGPDCAACPTCTDGVQNGSETGVDCGGPDCAACPTCTDGVQNGNETGVDCGGSCAACPTCTDGVQNGDETGVDCGGSCAPCGGGCSGTEVTVSITFDNYPEETSWSITNSSGGTVASGGTYGSSPDGSTFTETLCLADGCYDFIINDAYGDGICCSYGNGSYSVTSSSSTLASGGSFGASETTNFCLGSTPAPTCTDGIQNGSETGVDCGGSCAPCSTGGCDTVDSDGFEAGWGIWNDGGSDCARISNSTYASTGSYSIQLRDNTSTSVMTTDNLNLSSYDEVTVSFNFYARSMENNEDFWLQISTNGGSTYTTVAAYAQGSTFVNNTYYTDDVTISGPFSSNTRVRFRCDASGNSDYVYIDDVTIEGCSTGNTRNDGSITNTPELTEEVETLGTAADLALRLFPNPAKDILNVAYDNVSQEATSITVYDMTGRILMQKAVNTTSKDGKVQLDVSTLQEGAYLLQVNNGQQSAIQKFFVY